MGATRLLNLTVWSPGISTASALSIASEPAELLATGSIGGGWGVFWITGCAVVPFTGGALWAMAGNAHTVAAVASTVAINAFDIKFLEMLLDFNCRKLGFGLSAKDGPNTVAIERGELLELIKCGRGGEFFAILKTAFGAQFDGDPKSNCPLSPILG